jgi:hypothetical protein
VIYEVPDFVFRSRPLWFVTRDENKGP